MFIIKSLCFIGFMKLSHSASYESGALSISVSNNQLKQGTISFTKAFTNIPQVAIFPGAYDISGYIVFDFSIANIQKTSFDYKIQTYSSSIGWFYCYWRAMDDPRIEIINSFNTNVTGGGIQSFSFPHKNPMALYGYISPINFGQIGAIYFSVDIVSISKTDVIVEITQNTTNLISLGFQIILGSEQSFLKETPQTKYNMANGPINYIIIQQKSGYEFHIIIKAFNNPFQGYGTRLDFMNTVNNDNTLTYVIRYYTYINSFTYQLIWMNNKSFQPFLLYKMRKSKKFNIDLNSNYIQMDIIELNTVYYSFDNLDILIDKSITALNLKIKVHCYEDLKVVGTVLKCITCNQQNFSLNQVCYPGINQVNYHIKLFQPEQIDQQIKLKIALKQLTIYQSDIYNPGSTEYTVLDLSLQSI